MTKQFICPSSMQGNSSRGLALLQKAKSLAHSNTREKLKDITKSIHQDSLTLEEVKQLYTYLNKAQRDYQPKTRVDYGIPNSATCGFLAAGGNAGLAWTTKILQDEGILKSVTVPVEQSQIDNEDTLPGISLQVSKATNVEKRLATFVVLEPQNPDGTTSDLHLDWYDEDTVEQSCHNFNLYCRKSSILHLVDTNGFEFVESYITKTEMVLGNKYIKKGTWLATIYVHPEPEHEWIWQGIKDGSFNGLSVQCMASTEEM